MKTKSNAVQLYSEKSGAYLRLVKTVAYPQGIRAYFRESPLVKPNIHVLDAGCGTGIATMALRNAMLDRGFEPGELKCFDITPSMLDIFREELSSADVDGIELAQANVLDLSVLPENWNEFDLIISAAMLEYLPRERFVDALAELRPRLNKSGNLVLFITRNNWLTRPLIGKWWQANCYHETELKKYLCDAGFSTINFTAFPHPYMHLSLWGYIIEAQ